MHGFNRRVWGRFYRRSLWSCLRDLFTDQGTFNGSTKTVHASHVLLLGQTIFGLTEQFVGLVLELESETVPT
jgi:hypothetical protein